MNQPPENAADARDALASIQTARDAMIRSLDYHWSWDLLYGLIIALMVAGQGLPDPWNSLFVVFPILALVLMIKWWRERVGWWVNGYSPRRARWVAIGLALSTVALLGVTMASKWNDGPWWTPLATGGIAWVVAFLGGRAWTAVYRRELSESAA